jgi:hypothetical protein
MVDAILLDSGDPKATVKTLAEQVTHITGLISRKMLNLFQYRFSFAGGLHSNNVAKQ